MIWIVWILVALLALSLVSNVVMSAVIIRQMERPPRKGLLPGETLSKDGSAVRRVLSDGKGVQ